MPQLAMQRSASPAVATAGTGAPLALRLGRGFRRKLYRPTAELCAVAFLQDLELRLEVEAHVAQLLLQLGGVGLQLRLPPRGGLQLLAQLRLVAHQLLVELLVEVVLLAVPRGGLLLPREALRLSLHHRALQRELLLALEELLLLLPQLPLVPLLQLGEPLLEVLALHLELPGEQHRVLVDHRLVLLLEAPLLHLECRRVHL
mmetsp:Transcript_9993/g.24729  ORF Transcript_9993/g.24729 Transcript_9993/m.24729 type:complete len:202 (-) Transcript_9993:358-963(-)